jgi:murein L,D-transpeptidase YcbB/YkuD
MILSSNSESEEEININSIIRSRKMYDISLDEPVSIFIRYYTCTADNEGNIYFHPDIYSRDKKEIEELIRMTDQV